MSFATWLRNMKFARYSLESARDGRRATRSHRAVRFRPRLEPLEVREAPAADVGDTLKAALNTHLGPTAGTYTDLRDQIGDGKYGALDVDMFEFKANAGEALTATTLLPTGGTSMDTILRLFDANGNQLASNDDANGTLYSQIQNYVFSASGTYYVGVSGYPNFNYNPNSGGSGTGGSTGNYRLDLNLFVPTPDAAGDTLASAQATGLGPTPGTFSVNATIGDGLYLNNDVDLYKVTANAGQILTAVTSLPTGGTPINGVNMRLFDSTGNQLSIVYYGSDSSSQLQYQFASAGTYYIGLSGYPNYNYDPNVGGSGNPYYTPATGNYQLSLTLVTPVADAEGDTIATALATGLGPTAGNYTHTAHIGDGLYPMKDVDLYQIQANAGQLLTAITSLPTGGSAINGITMRLFDSTGNQLAIYYYGYGSSSRIDYQFASTGTYYVGISGYPNYNYDPNVGGSGSPYYTPATGDYQLSLTLVTPVADAEGDTIATALATGLGTADGSYSRTASIGNGLYPLQDVDMYQFQVSAGQVITANTSLPTGGTYMTPILRLFDSAGNQLGYTTYYYNNKLEYQFSTAGTYYVGVSGAWDTNYNPNVADSGYPGSRGDYQLNLTLATPTGDTAGDTLATAQATGTGPSNGTFSVNAHIGDGLYPLRDVDLYQFQATAGQGLIAATSQVTGGTFMYTTLRLFDSTGHQLAFDSLGSYPNSTIRYIFSTSGTLHRRVGVWQWFLRPHDCYHQRPATGLPWRLPPRPVAGDGHAGSGGRHTRDSSGHRAGADRRHIHAHGQHRRQLLHQQGRGPL